MKFLICWCFGVLSALLSTGVLSQAELGLDKPSPNAEVRRALAKKYAAAFAQVERQIPELSPSQEAWLKGEYHQEIEAAGGRYTKRSLAAMDSAEYQIFIAKPRTREIVAALTQIAAGGNRTKTTEVALWASVANKFIDYEYWQAIGNLVEAKKIERKIGHIDAYYYQNYALQARGILSKIVIPHIEGQLP